MRIRYLPYSKKFDRSTSTWTLVGRDSRASDFGVGAGSTMEEAEHRLHEWVLDSLLAAADDGQDRLDDLRSSRPRGAAVTFLPVDLVPLRLRFLRSRQKLSQADVARRLGLTQQAYSKLERPGANLQLRTIQQVEEALREDLLQLA